MIIEFIPPKNASIFDIVLNTYGSMDLLGKLISDNKITDVNMLAKGNEVFSIDYSKIKNYELFLYFKNNNVQLVTGDSLIQTIIPEEDYLTTEQPDVLETDDNDLFIID